MKRALGYDSLCSSVTMGESLSQVDAKGVHYVMHTAECLTRSRSLVYITCSTAFSFPIVSSSDQTEMVVGSRGMKLMLSS